MIGSRDFKHRGALPAVVSAEVEDRLELVLEQKLQARRGVKAVRRKNGEDRLLAVAVSALAVAVLVVTAVVLATCDAMSQVV